MSTAPVGREMVLASAAPMGRWMGEAREPMLTSLVLASGFSCEHGSEEPFYG